MINRSLVSICIPCYNAAASISETLEALTKQIYTSIEVIVIDSGSSDDSASIISSFIVKNERIQYYYKENTGAAAARNYAVEKSKGAYIIFLDADDLVDEYYVFELINSLGKSNKCIAACSYRRFYNNDLNTAFIEPLATWKNLKPIDWLLIDDGKGLGMMQSGMFLIPRSIFLEAGGWNEKLSLIDDFEFFPRLLLKADMIIYCSKTYLYYRSGNLNTLSGNSTSKALHSAYRALELTTSTILKSKNTQYSKNVLAIFWTLWSYHFYPKEKQLLKGSQRYILKLTGKNLSPPQTGLKKILSFFFGWKFTKRLKDIFTLKVS